MTTKNALGWSLIALPFVAIFLIATVVDHMPVVDVICVYVVCALIVAVIKLGCVLAGSS
jgi:hypothetical protein